ncbi:polymorphic toxin-type HINT domain-containing protein [Micromonospora sp. NPDC049374]|uniref:polymorphic toxin-type HINT domain-containing protein n=1 Tax=Micromonospora sp. NPDC049374 TaxID=3154352 RepID=UPI003415014D
MKVVIDTDGDQGTETAEVTATDGHPFWVPELGEWIDATDLQPGQWLQTSAGTYVQITAIDRWSVPRATVHNLTVANTHTYYVIAGSARVLVHNCDGEVSRVAENASKSAEAADYEGGSGGRVPALDYVNGALEIAEVRFDDFDAAAGVLIDRKHGVATTRKMVDTAVRQSMALEQNGYTGRWEVPNERALRRANKVFRDAGVTNIVAAVVKHDLAGCKCTR